MSRRAPNLTPAKVEAIVEIIRGWEGRLTWQSLIDKVSEITQSTYTRQALFKHEPIRISYETYQDNGPKNPKLPALSPALQTSIDRIHRLETENAELKKMGSLLMEQFARWAYNASTRGLSEEFLNQALPPTNRRGNRIGR